MKNPPINPKTSSGFAPYAGSRLSRATQKHGWTNAIVIGLMAALLAVVVRQWLMGSWFDAWENANYDDLIRQRALAKPHPDYSKVFIVAIDPESEKELGPFPWPRRIHARLVDELKRTGVSVVGFDVIFKDQSPQGPQDDAALAAAAARADNVVWAAMYPDDTRTEGGNVKGPLPQLARARGSRTGFANMNQDSDHVIRSVPAMYRNHQTTLLSLPLTIVQQYLHLPSAVSIRGHTLYSGSLAVPLDSRDRFLIPYVSPARPLKPPQGADEIRHVSFADVVSGQLPDDCFKGKIALVGQWDQRDQDDPDENKRILLGEDLHLTPYTAVSNLNDPKHDKKADLLQGNMYGVEIAAQTTLALLEHRFITPVGQWVTLLAMLMVSIAAALITSRLSPWLAVLPLGFLIVLYWEAAQHLFLVHSRWVEVYFVPLAILFSFVGVVAERELRERRERWRTIGLFSRYVAPKVVQRLLTDPEAATLGAAKAMDVTVIFCDIRDFVKHSTHLTAEEVLAWLSAHMEMMVEAIYAEDGSIDKYLGDGLMAVFGAPEPQPDHAARAVRAAHAMMVALDNLNEQRSQVGLWTYNIGIGIHSGTALVGSMGHHARPEYAVLGDTVNITFRIENRTKEQHARALISRSTYDAAGEVAYIAQYVGFIDLPGFEAPMEVYRIE